MKISCPAGTVKVPIVIVAVFGPPASASPVAIADGAAPLSLAGELRGTCGKA
jgi:hypothetical protein